LPKRGPPCQIGYHKAFNDLLKVLYTGMQWKEWPIAQGPNGQPEIHYTGVFKWFARWAEDGSQALALIASVAHLDQTQHLDVSLLHGDGSNTVAQKGATRLAIAGISIKPVRR
jgi:hypothetical protein